MKINPKVVSMEQYKLTDLEKEEYFFTIVSTHGDGEPPAAAKKFYDHIHSTNNNLSKLKKRLMIVPIILMVLPAVESSVRNRFQLP